LASAIMKSLRTLIKYPGLRTEKLSPLMMHGEKPKRMIQHWNIDYPLLNIRNCIEKTRYN